MCFAAMVQLSFGLRDYADWHHPNHDDYDWLDPFFLDSLVSRSCGLRSHLSLGSYAIIRCQVIFSLPYRFGHLGFVLGTTYQYGILKILIRRSKIRFLERLSITLMGYFRTDRFCCGLQKASLSIQQKTPKTNHQRSALSWINRKSGTEIE